VRTDDEQPYDENLLEVKCHEFYRRYSGLEPSEDYNALHHCRALLRSPPDDEGDHRYAALIYDRSDRDGACWEEQVEVMWDVPRYAFHFVDRPYSRDIHQSWAFRHPIGIPDDIMPKKWLDLLLVQ